MEERELTRLLQQLGDRVTPGPPPLRRIVDEGEALRGRRSARVRMFAVAAAAAAVVGGGSLAATVLDFPSLGGGEAQSTAGDADDNAGGGGSAPEAQGESGEGGGVEDGATAADAAVAVVITPDAVRPGETFELTSRDEAAGFGLAWRLERLTPDGWTPAYTLAAAFGEGEPQWWAEGESWVVEEPMVRAPLRFVVPPDADAGDYRLCEHDAPAVCASFTVTG